MVRPVARFRPAARRSTIQVDPVWVFNYGFSNFNTLAWQNTSTPLITSENHRCVVYSGSAGQVASVHVFDAVPLNVVEHNDAGVGALLLAAYPSLSPAATWINALVVATAPLATQVIDDVVYISMIRGSASMSKVQVSLSSGSTISSGTYCGRADYEVFTAAVSLDTGTVASQAAPLLQYRQVVTEFTGAPLGSSGYFKWTATTEYTGLAAAFANSLPSSHPFKSCGSSVWTFLNSPTAYPVAVGVTSQSNSSVFNGGSSLDKFHSPDDFRSHLDFASNSWNLYSRHLGYNTQTGQRMFSPGLYADASGVRELSTLTALPGGFTCNGYRYLGAQSGTSFDSYSPEAMEPLEDVVDLSGLATADQASVIAGSTAVAPPASVTLTSPVAGVTTTDETYIRRFGYPAEIDTVVLPDRAERLFRIID